MVKPGLLVPPETNPPMSTRTFDESQHLIAIVLSLPSKKPLTQGGEPLGVMARWWDGDHVDDGDIYYVMIYIYMYIYVYIYICIC